MTKDQKTEFLAKLQIGKKKGGTITEWARVGNVIVGTLVEERYEPIKTSNVVKIHTINDQQIAETLNSYYILLEEGTQEEFFTTLQEYQIREHNEQQNE